MKNCRNSLLGIATGYGICVSLKTIKLNYFNQTDDVTSTGSQVLSWVLRFSSVLLNQVNGDAFDNIFKQHFEL